MTRELARRAWRPLSLCALAARALGGVRSLEARPPLTEPWERSLPAAAPASLGDTRLSYREANFLAAALVGRLAENRGIRALVVKGSSLEHHGLRSGFVSADVDVLVEPGRFHDLLLALLNAGWERRPSAEVDRLTRHHSVTLVNPRWPNDIDLHPAFPGLLAGPTASFNVLWDHRERVMLGGVPCWIPDRFAAIVIWALHSARGTARQPRHATEMRHLTDIVLPRLSEEENHELAERIIALGADAPLRAVDGFARIIGDLRGAQAPGAWVAWQGTVAQRHDVSPWQQALREAPPRAWPWLIARAVWPSRQDLKVLWPSAVDSPAGRLRARLLRARRLMGRLLERNGTD